MIILFLTVAQANVLKAARFSYKLRGAVDL
ncbi:Protein of unknown function [Lactobacillus helveticus CIRM-BIA 101]|nr:Protein of unknown function [Lactobacillus helveticus CIRM-BIA 103]CDI66465.1 Protein of unknown function [Lactobacillus helveticus CIRM-BIA 101]